MFSGGMTCSISGEAAEMRVSRAAAMSCGAGVLLADCLYVGDFVPERLPRREVWLFSIGMMLSYGATGLEISIGEA